MLVRNKPIKNGGNIGEINYLMKQYDVLWCVADVYLDSIYNELAIKRSEHSPVLTSEGFESLIEKIDAKLAAIGWGIARGSGSRPSAAIPNN